MAARVAEPHDAVAGERAVAARLELALDGARRSRCSACVRRASAGRSMLRRVRRKARDAQRAARRGIEPGAAAGLVGRLRWPRRLACARAGRRAGCAIGRSGRAAAAACACRNSALTATPAVTSRKLRQRNASLPWGHYPYSCTPRPVPNGHYSKRFRKRSVNRRRSATDCGDFARPAAAVTATGAMPRRRGCDCDKIRCNFSPHRAGALCADREVCLLVLTPQRARRQAPRKTTGRRVHVLHQAGLLARPRRAAAADRRTPAGARSTAPPSRPSSASPPSATATRRPATAGAEFWATFVKKAEFGARVVVDLVSVERAQGRGDAGRGCRSPRRPARSRPGTPGAAPSPGPIRPPRAR